MGKRNRREFRATTSLKRTALLGLVMGVLVILAYESRLWWSTYLGWDTGMASDMLVVVTFFIGSLVGIGTVLAAIEIRRNGERLRWQDSSIDAPTEPSV